MPRSRPYRVGLEQRLRDPAYVAAYLNAAKDESQAVFMLALRDVAEAHKVSKVASAAGINRETLYRTLSTRGNPTLATFNGILDAIGVEREYRPREKHARPHTAPAIATEPSLEVKSATAGSPANAAGDYFRGLVIAGLSQIRVAAATAHSGQKTDPRIIGSLGIGVNPDREVFHQFIVAAANSQLGAASPYPHPQ
jgi:probable addiction module antidote protein